MTVSDMSFEEIKRYLRSNKDPRFTRIRCETALNHYKFLEACPRCGKCLGVSWNNNCAVCDDCGWTGTVAQLLKPLCLLLVKE